MLSNMKISLKLAVGFTAVIVVMLIMAGVSGMTLHSLSEIAQRNSDSSDAQDLVDQAAGQVNAINHDILAFSATNDPSYISAVRTGAERLQSQLESARKKIAADKQDVSASLEVARNRITAWLDGYVAQQLVLMQQDGAAAKIPEMFKANVTLSAERTKAIQAASKTITDWSDQEDRDETAARFQAGTDAGDRHGDRNAAVHHCRSPRDQVRSPGRSAPWWPSWASWRRATPP